MNLTRNVDELFDMSDLPPPFENSDDEDQDLEVGEEDDSTLQKIRDSIQLGVSHLEVRKLLTHIP